MAEQDAPHYDRAVSPGTSCAACEAFQRRWCTEFDFPANPAYTCDDWQARRSMKVPVTVTADTPTSHKEVGSSNFVVFKDKKDEYRWVLWPSDAFEDRDREVVSRKALEADVARSDIDGDYGPLRWWHVGNPEWPNPLDWTSVRAGPGLDLGRCDFSAMSGPVLIESGTFNTPELGAAIAAKASDLGVSLGFSHPLNEPDHEGVYHNIRRFERSLTPRHKASNPRAGVLVTKETSIVDDQKLGVFKEIVGEEIAAQTLQQAGTQEKAARAAGIREKEVSDPLNDLEQQVAALTQQIASFKAKAEAVTNGKQDGAPPVTTDSAVVADKAMGDGDAEDAADGADDEMAEGEESPMYVGDLTTDEFKALLNESLGGHFAPVAKALDLHGQMNKTLGEMKSYLGGLAQKDSTVAELREQLATLTVSLKEAQELLSDMQGEAPRALQNRQVGYKASEGADNIALPNNPFFQQEQAPQSPFGWVDSFVLNPQAGQ